MFFVKYKNNGISCFHKAYNNTRSLMYTASGLGWKASYPYDKDTEKTNTPQGLSKKNVSKQGFPFHFFHHVAEKEYFCNAFGGGKT